MNMDRWERCYNEGWQDVIVEEAFAHPAKFSRGLIRRIYAHAIEQGWFKAGDYVLDPFGGVALGGLEAMAHGLNWVGVELEQKFVALGEQNIALWNRDLRGWPNLGTARIIQGDSRNLKEIFRGVWSAYSSIPNEIQVGNEQKPDNLIPGPGPISGAGLIVSSPPFCGTIYRPTDDFVVFDNRPERKGTRTERLEYGERQHKQNYGHTPGNLANMKEGDIAAVIGSPPYAESVNAQSHGIDSCKAGPATGNRKRGEGTKMEATLRSQLNYGTTPGQLGSMREGDISAVISSPPYEEALSLKGGRQRANAGVGDGKAGKGDQPNSGVAYSADPSNLGNSSGETFWSASREIVHGCYDLLKPGGHAIWVTKNYVKAKKIVPFSDRWQTLCESVGFTLVCRHQAMLVENHGIQTTIMGIDEEITTERKSFFRRLAEKKGSPRIDYEDVICLEKPPLGATKMNSSEFANCVTA